MNKNDESLTAQNAKTVAGRLRVLISEATRVCSLMPDLQVVSAPLVAFSSFAPKSIEVKSEALTELGIIGVAVDRLIHRLALPIVIGVIGKYSAGKSSLLNALFREALGAELSPELVRKTDTTPTDVDFTYITHPDFAAQLRADDRLTVVARPDPFFRTLNFLDTPGTGWKFFERQQIGALLSSADLLLFVSEPTAMFEQTAVQTLSMKYREFPNVEMWFVVTHADHYVAAFGDWKTLEGDRFVADLAQYHKLLQSGTFEIEVEQQDKTLIAQRTHFKVGGNTFLVDAKFGSYGVADLLSQIRTRFCTSSAESKKRGQIRDEMRALYQKAARVLLQSAEHVEGLANSLHLAAVGAVSAEVNRFKHATVSTVAAQMTQQMLAQLRASPLKEIYRQASNGLPVPIAYAGRAPEVALLEQELEGLKRDRRSEGFLFAQRDALFSAENVRTKLDLMTADMENRLGQDLREQFGEAIRKALIGQRWTMPQRWSDRTRCRLEDLTEELKRDTASWAAQRRASLTEYLRKPADSLIELFDPARIDGTVLGRQRALLDDMKSWAPSRCKALREEILKASAVASTYSEQRLERFETFINARRRELRKEMLVQMDQCAYVPTKTYLAFMFAESEVTSSEEVMESQMPLGQFHVEKDKRVILSDIDGVKSRGQTELISAEQSWQEQWDKLDRELARMLGRASKGAEALKEVVPRASELLKSGSTRGLEELSVHLERMRGELTRQMEQGNRLIEEALGEAKQHGLRKSVLEWLAGGVGLVSAILGAWGAIKAVRPVDAAFFSVMAAGMAVFAWMVKRGLRHRGTFDTIFRTNYEVKRDALVRKLKEEIERTARNVEAMLAVNNHEVGNELHREFDKIIASAEEGRKDILPLLAEQIQLAAKLAHETAGHVTGIRDRAIDGIEKVVHEHLNAMCDRTEEETRKEFDTVVSALGAYYIGKLEEYSERYRKLGKEIATISTVASRELGSLLS